MKVIHSIVNSNGEIESYYDDEYFSEKENKLSFKKEVLAGIPVNGIYTQFPNTPLPSDLFGGTWENVSSDYEGCFFRCEGGEAKTFEDGFQEDCFQGHDTRIPLSGHTGNANDYGHKKNTRIAMGESVNETINNQIYNPSVYGGTEPISNSVNGTPRTGNETRPKNHTVRLWKRIS